MQHPPTKYGNVDITTMNDYFIYKGKSPPPINLMHAALRLTTDYGGLFYIDALINNLIKDFDIEVITTSSQTFNIFITGGDDSKKVVAYKSK
jgi:hypothetical protein